MRRAQQQPAVSARRLEGATDLDEAAEGAPGAAQGNAALGSSSREAGALGPFGGGAAPAGDLSEGDLSDFLAREGEDPGAYAARIFRRVFCTDIEGVLRINVRPLCFVGFGILSRCDCSRSGTALTGLLG